MEKKLIFLSVLGVLLVTSIAGTAYYVVSRIKVDSANREMLSTGAANKFGADQLAEAQAEADARAIVGEDRAVEMTITDDSVSPNGIPAYKDKQLTIKATNNAKDIRSLVIEKINFSESIKAGETKEILVTVPDQTGSYEYKLLSSDGVATATGKMIVI